MILQITEFSVNLNLTLYQIWNTSIVGITLVLDETFVCLILKCLWIEHMKWLSYDPTWNSQANASSKLKCFLLKLCLNNTLFNKYFIWILVFLIHQECSAVKFTRLFVVLLPRNPWTQATKYFSSNSFINNFDSHWERSETHKRLNLWMKKPVEKYYECKLFIILIYNLPGFSYIHRKKRIKSASAMTGKDWKGKNIFKFFKATNMSFWNMSFIKHNCSSWFECLYNLFLKLF